MPILCIDDDSSFCQILEDEAQAMGLQITLASSIEEAQRCLKVRDYSGAILNFNYLKAEGMMRQMMTSLVCYDLPRVDDLPKLKKIHRMNFVAGKPMSSHEAHYFLAKLGNVPSNLEPICDWVKDIPQKLMEDYLQLAYERLALIHTLIQKAKTKPSSLVWEELQTVVHKIAGSAGMYGRCLASQVCKDMELQLKNKDYSNINLDTFYRQLYLYIQ